MHRADRALGAGGGGEAEKQGGGKGAGRNPVFCLLSRKPHPGRSLKVLANWFKHWTDRQ
jgi:hypothetical protein